PPPGAVPGTGSSSRSSTESSRVMEDRDRTEGSPNSDLIALGIIRRPHGVRGEASVEPWTDDPARLSEVDQVILVSPDEARRIPARIETARSHQDRVLVRFDGIASPEKIRELQNWTIEIPEQDARPLDADEYFMHQLVGLSVVDPKREPIGEVAGMEAGGGGWLLSVRTPDGTLFDLPFARALCREIDLERNVLVADIPPGLMRLEEAEEIPRGPAREHDGDSQDEAAQQAPSLRIDVVTIFPRMFEPFLEDGVIARGVKSNRLRIRIWDLREFATDRHRSTDDEAYGGGAGMVMLAEPVFRCLDAIGQESGSEPGSGPLVLMLSPQGRRFDQQTAMELSAQPWLVLLCGRYEGFDERVRQAVVDAEISIGDFVVSGGEVPAMAVIDAVGRMVEGVVGRRNSVEADSFYYGLLDHPHYTRPAEIRGMKVPEVLLSGHAENIRQWRKKEALRATLIKRADLLEGMELDDEGREMLGELEEELRSSGQAD
ncbi:MAG TPA: tRNA (guanosine(37)-N1)-methyltransferase TrmD, partial [Thermoanaerobaculia bacterium]|nr:tRNA (guanosine(37)-N1)-methyltransferase TrmD [Thermoanaerobaculia bacterium]